MATKTLPYTSKPRLFILSDITNEPDDTQSLCRYLTYANQFDTEGIIATTSTWLRNKVAPEAMHVVVNGYEKVVDNLNVHTHPESQYPSADHLRSLIKPGAPVYGMEAVGDDIPLSEGAKLLLESLERPDPRPLWVLIWSGANVLASVVYHIRNRPDAADLRAKLRVYSISDQDDTGAWLRQQWPEIFYICAVHGWNQYFAAGWLGISSDLPGEEGADPTTVKKEWLKEHIQIGPLGAEYPDILYAMEGDTPTFLYHVQNGLNFPDRPSWGSWGGRFLPVNVSYKGVPNYGHHADASDFVIGLNDRPVLSNKATIWRWRQAFQHDFAAHMQWSINPEFSKANHQPVVVINGDKGFAPLHIDVDAGSAVELDATETYDPDDDSLTFKWFQYKEPSALNHYHGFEVAPLEIEPIGDG
ncbi:hypothetical protein FOPG_17522 [Fusarium oxysporum f. sp. conglutinans race 2 54008]|uniref:Cellulose-binding protein n=3 Tax=Fusarium oxysporum f. sp. conglutinans TaxID=100902 RepID=A0A8H6LNU1_FUSOX|nr:hypothetical protein FOXB_15785 [Fusarium oxysporum f. sp. conglutinans Fo5176]EXL66300.1 hypothetical protein FOPG_17522 [Fusarium oxysporum f. sp. conglutinans race 2 54008]KAF6525421.1 hypothetical protein HZS61_011216 [Fusarium oxysporum f. sp. conglutinans]KAG6997357.1 hypothetical protein FocnCong_v015437 [Fusarium oxysporum f. sp. conglutinans]